MESICSTELKKSVNTSVSTSNEKWKEKQNKTCVLSLVPNFSFTRCHQEAVADNEDLHDTNAHIFTARGIPYVAVCKYKSFLGANLSYQILLIDMLIARI